MNTIPQDIYYRGSKVLVVGNSGTGKSTFAVRYIFGSIREGVRVFVFDHQGEYAARLACPACVRLEELDAITEERRNPLVIFDPSVEFESDLPAGFDFFCKWTFAKARRWHGKKLLVADELQKLVTTNQISAPLAAVIETGRRYHLDGLYIGQAGNLLHNRIRNQITVCVAFRTLDENAAKMLDGLGFPVEDLPSLPPGAFILRELDTGTIYRGALFQVDKKGGKP